MVSAFAMKEKPAVQHGRLEDGGEEEELLLLVVDGLMNKHGFIKSKMIYIPTAFEQCE